MRAKRSSRFSLTVLVVLIFGVTGSAALVVVNAKNQQTPIRAVSITTATLTPTTISATGTGFDAVPATATITVSVATSIQVVEGTIARVELREDNNTSGVSYTVSGGNADSGRTFIVPLRGNGYVNTLLYTVTGTSTSPAGSVLFRATLRSVTNPPNTSPPAPFIEGPNFISMGLMLTFQRPPSGGGGGRMYECAGNADKPCGIEQDPFDSGGVVTPPNSQCCDISPIVVDIAGDGFKMTTAQDGVDFDFNSDGYPHRISWTAADTDDAWLALDRNADGKITLGAELFGNISPQPPSNARNGFLSLAEFDKVENGGNNDNVIDENDEIFGSLRLWQDINHNGISEASELHTLPELGVRMFELRYRESKRTDEYGNRFRYRAKVWSNRDSKAGRWAWDVFLIPAP